MPTFSVSCPRPTAPEHRLHRLSAACGRLVSLDSKNWSEDLVPTFSMSPPGSTAPLCRLCCRGPGKFMPAFLVEILAQSDFHFGRTLDLGHT